MCDPVERFSFCFCPLEFAIVRLALRRHDVGPILRSLVWFGFRIDDFRDIWVQIQSFRDGAVRPSLFGLSLLESL